MNAAAAAIDPELVAASALLRERGLVALNPATAPLGEARAALARISAFLNEGSVPLCEERDLAIPAPGRNVPCRLYRPAGIARPPLLVYAHGGSFALGDLDGWDGALRALVRESGVAVLHVDYRLAPEHRFPAGFDDMVAVIRHVAHAGEALGIDPQQLAAGGDFGRGQSRPRRGARLARRRRLAAPLPAPSLWRLLDRWRQPVLAALRVGCLRALAGAARLGVVDLSQPSRAEERLARRAAPGAPCRAATRPSRDRHASTHCSTTTSGLPPVSRRQACPAASSAMTASSTATSATASSSHRSATRSPTAPLRSEAGLANRTA